MLVECNPITIPHDFMWQKREWVRMVVKPITGNIYGGDGTIAKIARWPKI
jgi:hypothetical protein